MSKWQTLESKIIYKNPWTIIREDKVLNPVGQEVTYAIVDATSGSVYVVPIDDEGYTYIIKQYRYPIQQDSWECVAGGADEGALEDGARRELLEETGLEADGLTHIGILHPATGRATYKCHVYIAHHVKKVSDELDEVDGISSLRRISFAEVVNMIMRGEITCSQSIAAFMMAREYVAKAGNA